MTVQATQWSNQSLRAHRSLSARNITHHRRLRSRMLRRAIAGSNLIRFVTQIFPALLVNTLHLQVAEETAFSRTNPTGHLNFSAQTRNAAFFIVRPRLWVSVSRLVGQLARARKSTRRMSRTFPREWFNILHAADGFSVPMDRLSCAGQSFFLRGSGYPAHGICVRQHEQRKNKGWQDRLAPVLGAQGDGRYGGRQPSHLISWHHDI